MSMDNSRDSIKESKVIDEDEGEKKAFFKTGEILQCLYAHGNYPVERGN